MIKKVTREEAIDYLEWIRPKKPYTGDRMKVQAAIDMAIEALKEEKICPVYSDSEVRQPCVNCLECELERPQWIPVSERLPSYSEKIVLATVVRRDKTWNNEPYHRLVTYMNGKWYPVPQSINLVPSHMATIEQSDGGQAEVIAWMPLPETYREVTRE